MDNIVATLDIGSSKVCVIVAELKKHQFNVLGVGTSECKGVKKGIIVDIDSAVSAIQIAVRQAEHMSNRQIKSVFTNIPGGYTSIIRNRGVIAVTRDDREITKEDVQRVINAAQVIAVPSDKEIIDIIPEQFVVDGYEGIRDPIGMVGVRLELEANLVLASCTSVQNIIRSIHKAELEVDGIIVEPLATSTVVLNDDEKELGVALIDVGADTTDISIFKKGTLGFTKVIPVGGNNLTNDISIVCKISSADSEKIKRQYGVANEAMMRTDEILRIPNIAGKGEKEVNLSDVAKIMDARIYEMLYLIKKHLVESGEIDNLSAGVVLTGGGLFNIKGMIDYASEYLDMPVRFGYPNYIGVANPIYSTSAGLALYALKQKRASKVISKASQDVNSYEEEDDDYKPKKTSNDFIEKVKSFFADFF